MRPGRVLAARLDSAGDVLLCGPAVRALARRAGQVTFLCGPRGRAAAELLPGVADIVEYHAPWVDLEPPELTNEAITALIDRLRGLGIDEAVVFTSFHQSPLPLALVLRMAGVRRISAISVDYPGSLLDVRHLVDDDIPEPERALSLAAAAGFTLDPDDDGRLRIRQALPDIRGLAGEPGYVVLHPGAAVPARRMSAARSRSAVAALVAAGHRVLVTGAPSERELTAEVAGTDATDLGGKTDFATLAAVMRQASVVVAPNTGPAHVAAAVGTPVVSLFAPVVPARRWAPYGVAHMLLGDQHAPCASSRARICPVPGHPCLDGITDDEIVSAVSRLTRIRGKDRTP
ncbi:glycosyltransferase family 9 protein [Nocardia wallacei]|uniref:glycosyltransferase family 9 protein n=1 Tax=Nocardia wallacei TaxID=480035 RepID=UPI00245571A8|nr:glycosyltransferase family 9 protein [Nocardia wallacei]